MINETKIWLNTSAKIDWNELEYQIPFLDDVMPCFKTDNLKTHLDYCRNIDFKFYGEDSKRLQDYSNAIKFVVGRTSSNNIIQFDDFLAAQKILLKKSSDLRTTTAYCYRNGKLAFYPKETDLENLMKVRIQFINSLKTHPFIKATLIYLDIIFIHPFKDGNARAARIWADFFLCKYEMDPQWILRIISIHKSPNDDKIPIKFLKALMKSTLSI